MSSKITQRLLSIAIFIVGLSMVPALAWGGEVADDSEADQVETTENSAEADDVATHVTIDDMTVEEASDASVETGAFETTYQQRRGDGGTDLVSTIGLNALWGGLTGGLIGLGVYLLTDFSPWVIPQFAGGGILVGGTVGLITGLTRAEPETTAMDDLGSPASVDWVEREAPETFDVRLLDLNF